MSFQRGETLRRRLKTPPTGELMWCEPNGKLLSRHAEVSNFARLLKEAELPRRTPHDIRHTTATLMIAEGASILQVQHQLRHSTPSKSHRYLLAIFLNWRLGATPACDEALHRQTEQRL